MTDPPRCCDRPMARGGLVRCRDRGRVWFEQWWRCECCGRSQWTLVEED